jgi:hypothetical protein
MQKRGHESLFLPLAGTTCCGHFRREWRSAPRAAVGSAEQANGGEFYNGGTCGPIPTEIRPGGWSLMTIASADPNKFNVILISCEIFQPSTIDIARLDAQSDPYLVTHKKL